MRRMLPGSWARLVAVGMLATAVACVPAADLAENVTGEGDEAGRPATATVRISHDAFVPSSMTVQVGQTITWVNDESESIHTVTSGHPGDVDVGAQFNSGPILPTGTWEYAFAGVGTFVYHCQVHSQQQQGMIVVVP